MHALALLYINQYMTFEVPSINNSKYMIVGGQNWPFLTDGPRHC